VKQAARVPQLDQNLCGPAVLNRFVYRLLANSIEIGRFTQVLKERRRSANSVPALKRQSQILRYATSLPIGYLSYLFFEPFPRGHDAEDNDAAGRFAILS
jgi:hypothetical protein